MPTENVLAPTASVTQPTYAQAATDEVDVGIGSIVVDDCVATLLLLESTN
jgi:hypothetical protein